MNKIVLILIAIMLSACSSSSKKAAENLYYRFPENTIQPIQDLNIEVKRPSALGILGNRPMVVQTSDAGLIQMSNNFWLDSPKVLLQNYLEKVFVSNSDKQKLTLNSQILALEKKHNQALLSIKFSLIGSQNTLIFNKIYKSKSDMPNSSIATFSKTIGSLLEEMVGQLSKDLQ